MAGAVQKKINDVVNELNNAPDNHLLAREGILESITLTREFAQTMLNALCEKFTSASGSYSLPQVCENLAQQRAICYGARQIKTTFKKFVFPTYEVVNGALGLSEPNTSFMGIAASHILDEYPITLSSVGGTTQTEGPNTFSTYIGDYYFTRSRVDGELVDINSNLTPYTTPDGDIPFGNTIAWGADVSGEQAANTWNYHWAKANTGTVDIINPGAYNELTTLTLTDHLTQGSNTDYDPVGPQFGNIFYLKRHADSVNTFTITGTTTKGSQEVTEVSDSDMAKVKYSDVITSNNLPMGYYGPTKIAAAKAAENKIRITDLIYDIGTVEQSMNTVTLTGGTWPMEVDGGTIEFTGGIEGGGKVISRPSDIKIVLSTSANVESGQAFTLTYGGVANSNGITTFTINSVPFGHGKDDIFCQVKITAEGIVKNPNWKPIGDGVGGYSGAHEGPDDTLTANTTQFVGLLGFYDPDNGSANATNDLTRSAREDFSSQGKEFNETDYPNIETNPFKPAVGITHQSYKEENNELTGTQPASLSGDDVYTGRYIRWDVKRASAQGAEPEHRYYTDSAEKFYYELPCDSQYTCGTATIGATHTMPNSAEPPIAITKTGLSDCVSRIHGASVSCVGVTVDVSATGDVPADDNTTHPALSGSFSPPSAGSTIGNYYTVGGDNYIYINRLHYENVTSGNSGWTATLSTDTTVFPCRYNFAQKHIYEGGGTANSTMNADVQFIRDTVDDLQAVRTFRDPLIPELTAEAGASGISDGDFDSYIGTEPDADLAALSTSLTNYRNSLNSQNRTGDNNGNNNKGSVITYANTAWAAFHSEMQTFLDNCLKRVTEIDARIGTPTRSGTRATTRGTPPKIRVSAIPSSNTTGGQAPYGRSIYNNVNNLLGKDLDLLGKLIQDVQSLTTQIDLVRKARNKFEMYNGRDKEY